MFTPHHDVRTCALLSQLRSKYEGNTFGRVCCCNVKYRLWYLFFYKVNVSVYCNINSYNIISQFCLNLSSHHIAWLFIKIIPKIWKYYINCKIQIEKYNLRRRCRRPVKIIWKLRVFETCLKWTQTSYHSYFAWFVIFGYGFLWV